MPKMLSPSEKMTSVDEDLCFIFFGQEINIDSFGQEINIDKSHVAHIPMSELRQLKMMCGVTSN